MIVHIRRPAASPRSCRSRTPAARPPCSPPFVVTNVAVIMTTIHNMVITMISDHCHCY